MAIGVAGALVAGGAGTALARQRVRTERSRQDPAERRELDLPGDILHRTLPTSDGGILHLVETGNGSPIVLLHGVTLSVRTWPYQLRSLAAAGHRVIAVDQRGHGRSVAGDDGPTISAMADDVATLLESLDLESAVVVGHSMGSMVTLRFAARHPGVVDDRVAALALVGGSAGLWLPVPRWPYVAGAAGTAAERSLERMERRNFATLPRNDLGYLIARVGLGASPRPSHVELTLSMVREMDTAALAKIVPDLLSYDEWESIPAIRTPTLVAVGSRDRLTPPVYSRRLAAALPDARMVTYRGAGHMLMLERHDDLDAELLALARGAAASDRRRPRAKAGPT